MVTPERQRLLLLAMLLLLMTAAGAVRAEFEAGERIKLLSVTYAANLSRDPFDLPDFTVEGPRNTEELDLAMASLVGVVRLPDGFIALVEDENGDSYALSIGDPVWRGHVSGIDEAALVASVRQGGLRQRIRLELVKEGE